MSGEQVAIRRCSTCGLNWADQNEFARCDNCGHPTARMAVDRDMLDERRAPTREESLEQRRLIMEERAFAARAADAASIEARRRSERVIAAATAALDWDLDNWLTTDPSDWGPAAELR